MKQFITKIILFALFAFCAAMALDYVISSRLRQNENRMYVGWNAIYNDTTHYDLVVLGNSRAWCQYDPCILDSVLRLNTFNLGIDGSAINRQIIKYNKYAELHGAPMYMIQNIDLSTMAITHGYEREQFFSYFFFDRDLISSLDKYEDFSFAEKYIPCYRYLGYDDVLTEAFFQDNKKHYFDFLTKGYKGSEHPWQGDALAEMNSVVCSCDTMALALFKDFVSEVIEQGTKIVFVYAPLYYQVTEKMTNKEEMYQMYQNVASAFNIPILDYTDMPLCNDTAYFYNGTHLNKTGAEIFTTQLAMDLDSLGVE